MDKVQAADKVRTWTDVNGRTMEAEFVREVDGDVAGLLMIIVPEWTTLRAMARPE